MKLVELWTMKMIIKCVWRTPFSQNLLCERRKINSFKVGGLMGEICFKYFLEKKNSQPLFNHSFPSFSENLI